MATYWPHQSLLALLIACTFYLFPTIAHAQEPDANVDCPPQSDNIWVRPNNPAAKFSPDDPDDAISIPFDTGEVETNGHTYVNYLLGVLMGEVAPADDFRPVDDETLRAMAILARTVAHYNCRLYTFNGHYGMDDDDKQVYNPPIRNTWLNDPNMGQAEIDRYQQAIDDTDGVTLAYNGRLFDAQYRNRSERWTANYDENNDGIMEPHKRVYDPAGFYHDNVGNGVGLAQKNANHYALGQNDIGLLPPYNASQLLTHYLTQIEFVGLEPRLSHDWRFNLLTLSFSDGTVPHTLNDQRTAPLILSYDTAYAFGLVVQNTGHQTWELNCNGQQLNVGYHLYTYPDKTYKSPEYLYFERGSSALCPETSASTHLAPGQEFPSQENSTQLMYMSVNINSAVAPGDYWMRFDLVRPQPNKNIWLSGITPNNDPTWPTQDVHICVESCGTPPTPTPTATPPTTPEPESHALPEKIAHSL